MFGYRDSLGEELANDNKVTLDIYTVAVENEYYRKLSRIIMDPKIQLYVDANKGRGRIIEVSHLPIML